MGPVPKLEPAAPGARPRRHRPGSIPIHFERDPLLQVRTNNNRGYIRVQ